MSFNCIHIKNNFVLNILLILPDTNFLFQRFTFQPWMLSIQNENYDKIPAKAALLCLDQTNSVLFFAKSTKLVIFHFHSYCDTNKTQSGWMISLVSTNVQESVWDTIEVFPEHFIDAISTWLRSWIESVFYGEDSDGKH